MATHSSILAWRIPRTEEPSGLPSMGSQIRTRLKRLSSSSSSMVNVPFYITHSAWEWWKASTFHFLQQVLLTMCWPVFYTLRVEKQNCRADTANVFGQKLMKENSLLGPGDGLGVERHSWEQEDEAYRQWCLVMIQCHSEDLRPMLLQFNGPEHTSDRSECYHDGLPTGNPFSLTDPPKFLHHLTSC